MTTWETLPVAPDDNARIETLLLVPLRNSDYSMTSNCNVSSSSGNVHALRLGGC